MTLLRVYRRTSMCFAAVNIEGPVTTENSTSQLRSAIRTFAACTSASRKPPSTLGIFLRVRAVGSITAITRSAVKSWPCFELLSTSNGLRPLFRNKDGFAAIGELDVLALSLIVVGELSGGTWHKELSDSR